MLRRSDRSHSRFAQKLTAMLLTFTGLVILSCSAENPVEPAAAEPERALAPSGRAYSEDRTPCDHRDPLKQPFWGELHVHSSLSMDAWLWKVRGTPDDVYGFAQGRPISLPAAQDDQPMRTAQLERPLDFAALTDHASYQGEVYLCTRPGSAKYDSEGCQIYRGEKPPPPGPPGGFAARMGALSNSIDRTQEVPSRKPELCGDDLALCKEAMTQVWREQQAAAERHYDRSSDCRFTTFNAYEYTATPGLAKVHHNVIFRNHAVPETPTAWIDYPDVYDLWSKLRDECLEAGTGCDALTLPHNSNLSNGRMFTVPGRDRPLSEQQSMARLRAELEPLVEISQIKGDSECRNDMYGVVGAPDEFCDYEEWRAADTEDCEEGTGRGALAGQGCVSRLDYVRHVLVEGLREQDRIGVNPYKLGIVAATDAHNANPGDVEEYSYDGWHGSDDATIKQRLQTRADGGIGAVFNIIASPGGLAGVWAEENSRDSLFDALEKREVFGTSGPRMTARFFGGWQYPKDLCQRSDLVEQGYATGVPMGSDLPQPPHPEASPTFIVSAMRDTGIPGHPGGLLQRAQIIKGWLGDDGQFYEKVFDVAGGANNADVDLDTCEPRGEGTDTLCAVWSDPDFDPDRGAVYYARVLENPSCRWSQRQCNQLPSQDRPAGCTNPPTPRTIQERLWTSPIWYSQTESHSS
ncbi:MAG: hypothetical protein CBC48_17035 [bacterium TMED88]|nr:hypothetical protein [Deltaproteobacteria bacterium]OUV24993.1 MAG: hypothetical protein CBC48_17035 [bacterium TMED88]